MGDLTLMAVHAHPDDEASGTGGILARYSAEGIRTVLVTCTNGELGDGPDHVKPDADGHDPQLVAKIRKTELEASCEALGVSHLEMLGYHDSGMQNWGHKEREDVFCNVPLEESSAKLVELMKKYQPQVVVTYNERGGYGHPDHVRAHEITMAAVEASGIPAKVYFTGGGRRDMSKIRAIMEEQGIEWPPTPTAQPRGDAAAAAPAPPPTPPDPEQVAERERRMAEAEARITTTIDVSTVSSQKHAALRAHASQLDMSFWMRVPEAAVPLLFAEERFIRFHDTTGAPTPEDDLFAGLR